ncbi:MAG: glycoside hydrolase family 9 protein, partial [candidate division KSB1 bacterium]|nr:glycoside hydrolase family 9 protein [candidate division KSB1 bacterium]
MRAQPILLMILVAVSSVRAEDLFLRLNQVGFLPQEEKTALAFSHRPSGHRRFEIVEATSGRRVLGPVRLGKDLGAFARFAHHYEIDLTPLRTPGLYELRILGGEGQAVRFTVGPLVYRPYPAVILSYLRQQRCGYNPFLDEVCHPRDGRTYEGPVPDGTYLDVTGGWHDAGDYLRYLLTSSNTVGRLLLAFRLFPSAFSDSVDALGHPFPNGVPDVLDEARWGLEWMLKLHPAPDQLYHQVADDRDHTGWDLPHRDTSDYGWGPGSYRIVYYATGRPQGLGEYQSQSTGIANLAGRYAAAMAMAAEIFAKIDPPFAEVCLRAAREVYALGLKQPGCQEGTPCRAPYRYHEATWADDMEWGAAELFRVTGDSSYLHQALRFARMIGPTSWMGLDTLRHYEYYPFFNAGHWALWTVAPATFRDTLAAYYREGIQAIRTRALRNPYRVGHPFVWCSNNLAAAVVNQILLYERMTGDSSYRDLLHSHRDWLLGKNPWGVSQFVGIPLRGGRT